MSKNIQTELDCSERMVITTHLHVPTKNTGEFNITKYINKILQLAKDNDKNQGKYFLKW